AERAEEQADHVLERVLGHPRERPVDDQAGRDHQQPGGRGACRRERDAVRVGAEGDHDEDTSSPSSRTPLNDTVKANQSRSNRVVAGAWGAASGASGRVAPSSWSALRPAERSIALRSHCTPNSRSSTPPTSCRSVRETAVAMAVPNTAVTTAS